MAEPDSHINEVVFSDACSQFTNGLTEHCTYYYIDTICNQSRVCAQFKIHIILKFIRYPFHHFHPFVL
jgi:hypothetical protein